MQDSRGEHLTYIYPYKLLGKFHEWLEETYIPDKFYTGVKKYLTLEKCKLILEAIGYEIKPKNKRII